MNSKQSAAFLCLQQTVDCGEENTHAHISNQFHFKLIISNFKKAFKTTQHSNSGSLEFACPSLQNDFPIFPSSTHPDYPITLS